MAFARPWIKSDDEGDGRPSDLHDPTNANTSNWSESPSSPHRLTLAKQRQQCKQFCSQLISVRQFQSNYLNVIDNADLDRNLLDLDVYDMAGEMGIPVETVQELSQVCRLVNCSFTSTGLHRMAVQ